VAALGLALAGCTSSGSSPAPSRTGRTGGGAAPSPDDAARRRAITTATELLADLAASSAVPAALASALDADHRAQLTALGGPPPTAGLPPLLDPTGTTSPSATSSSRPGPTARALVSAETAGAGQALGDSAKVGPQLAELLVRVAAARAVHADLLARAAKLPVPTRLTAAVGSAGPTGTSGSSGSSAGTTAASAGTTAASAGTTAASAGGTPSTASRSPGPIPTLSPTTRVSRSTADLDALARVVEAEHAAVFGYALVVPRVPAPQQPTARAVWDAHRIDRDRLEALLVAAGSQPPAALPAYAVDPPGGAAQARTLAARIEAGVARVGLWAVGRGADDVRAAAADVVVAATRQRAGWLGALPPFG
jgi:hypothetical protein